MKEEKLKELEGLVDDALSKGNKEALTNGCVKIKKQELETYRAFVDGRTILSEHSDEDILQTSAAMVGRDSQLNQAETNKSTIKQGWSYWDVAITYEFRIYTSSPPSRAEWTFTSEDTDASIFSVLEMAFSKFYVFRYDWLRAGYELRFINLNIKLIEK